MALDDRLSCVYPEVARVHHQHLRGEAAFSTSDRLQQDRFGPMAFAGHVDNDVMAPALPAHDTSWRLVPADWAHIELTVYDRDLARRIARSTALG